MIVIEIESEMKAKVSVTRDDEVLCGRKGA
jgi:hypothetical protein